MFKNLSHAPKNSLLFLVLSLGAVFTTMSVTAQGAPAAAKPSRMSRAHFCKAKNPRVRTG